KMRADLGVLHRGVDLIEKLIQRLWVLGIIVRGAVPVVNNFVGWDGGTAGLLVRKRFGRQVGPERRNSKVSQNISATSFHESDPFSFRRDPGRDPGRDGNSCPSGNGSPVRRRAGRQ